MYKHCTVIQNVDNPEAFETTRESLEQTFGFESLYIILVSEKKIYELQVEFFQTIYSLPKEQYTYIGGVDDMLQLINEIERVDVEILFFISAGDTIDPHYMDYLDYFFEENGSEAPVLLTPVIETGQDSLPEQFANIPYDGVMPLLSLPNTIKGGAIFLPAVKDIEVTKTLGLDALADLFLKSILAKKCYGIINTVYCRSEFLEPIAYSYELSKSLLMYCEVCLNDVPNSLSEKLLPVPHITITNIQNCYSDVEITGTYILPVDVKFVIESENEIKYTLSEKNDNSSYLHSLRNQGEFLIIATLNENAVNISFIQYTDSDHLTLNIRNIITKRNKNYVNNFTVESMKNNLSVRQIAPRAHFLISCIIPIYNCATYLKDAIDSVIKQSVGFFEKVLLILVNDGSTDQTDYICEDYRKKFPFNITYIKQEHLGVSVARNNGLKCAIGKFIAFLDADDKFPSKYFETAVKYLEKYENAIDMIAFPIELFGMSKDKSPPLNFRFNDTRLVDVSTEYRYLHYSVCSAVYSHKAIENISFNESLKYYEDADFVHKVLLQKMCYYLVRGPAYMYRMRETGDSASQLKRSDKNWYEITLWVNAFVRESIETKGVITQYTQNMIVHTLMDYAISKVPQGILGELNSAEVLNIVSESLLHVEDYLVFEHHLLSRWQKYLLLKLKYKEIVLKSDSEMPTFYAGDLLLEELCPEVYISFIHEHLQQIKIFGYYQLPTNIGADIIAEDEYDTYVCNSLEDTQLNIHFMGYALNIVNVFEFNIPFYGQPYLSFYLRLDTGEKYPIKPIFSDQNSNSRLLYMCKSTIITRSSEAHKIKLEALTTPRMSELVMNILKPYPKNEYASDYTLMDEYMRLYPLIAKNRIWLFINKPGSASSASEVFYRYCIAIKDNIDKYFIIQQNSLDDIRLRDIGKTIEYGGIMHKLLYLYAEKIIVSDEVENAYEPFDRNELFFLYRSLIKSEIVYLPEQRITEDRLKSLNRFKRNIGFIAVSSIVEQKFAVEHGYGLSDSIVKITGKPQFDELYSEPQNRIIFMPTWRENLYDGSRKHFKFSDSEYCRQITNLLCDDRLAEAMLDYDYEMDFIPDEKLYLHLGDIDMFENVNVILPKKSRSEYLKFGSLLITDFMPAFEFAYMKKPVIYYSFVEAGNIEKDSFFDPLSMGFGEVVSDREILVDLIIDYMHNSCTMEKNHEERLNAYFNYLDKSNCKRIYENLQES